MKNQPESYWKEKLTPEQYKVVWQKGTERAFSGVLYYNHEAGMYNCVACGQPWFSSDAKFESGSGWPSFDDPVKTEPLFSTLDDLLKRFRFSLPDIPQHNCSIYGKIALFVSTSFFLCSTDTPHAPCYERLDASCLSSVSAGRKLARTESMQ